LAARISGKGRNDSLVQKLAGWEEGLSMAEACEHHSYGG